MGLIKRSVLGASVNVCDIPVTYYYMITVHASQKRRKVLMSELKAVIFVLKFIQRVHLVNECYENSGEYEQLHVHLVARSKYPLYYKAMSKLKGYRIHYDRLVTSRDVHNAQIYVSKSQYNGFSFSEG